MAPSMSSVPIANMAVWKPARYQHTLADGKDGKRGDTRCCLRRCLRAFSLTFPQDSEPTNTSSIPLEPRPRLTRPSHPFVYQITYSDHPRPASRPDAITSPSHHTCADTRRATLENPHNQKIQAALPPSPAKIDTLQPTACAASICAASTHSTRFPSHKNRPLSAPQPPLLTLCSTSPYQISLAITTTENPEVPSPPQSPSNNVHAYTTGVQVIHST